MKWCAHWRTSAAAMWLRAAVTWLRALASWWRAPAMRCSGPVTRWCVCRWPIACGRRTAPIDGRRSDSWSRWDMTSSMWSVACFALFDWVCVEFVWCVKWWCAFFFRWGSGNKRCCLWFVFGFVGLYIDVLGCVSVQQIHVMIGGPVMCYKKWLWLLLAILQTTWTFKWHFLFRLTLVAPGTIRTCDDVWMGDDDCNGKEGSEMNDNQMWFNCFNMGGTISDITMLGDLKWRHLADWNYVHDSHKKTNIFITIATSHTSGVNITSFAPYIQGLYIKRQLYMNHKFHF